MLHPMIRILVVEDHALYREGLKSLLNRQHDMEVVGECGDGSAALAAWERLKPDMVLLDLSLPDMDGQVLARRLIATDPEARIAVLTVHTDETRLGEALRAGVLGYATKDTSSENLLAIVRNAALGRRQLCPEVMDGVVRAFLDSLDREGEAELGSLSGREREVLDLVACGLKNKAIAERLYLSVKTVEKHKANIASKLGLPSVTALRRLPTRRSALD